MNKNVESGAAAPAAGDGVIKKKKGTVVSILSVILGIIIGAGVAYMQFRFALAENPSNYFDNETGNYIWVNVFSLTAPWFLACALGTPMVAFAYVAFKRMLNV